MTLPTTADVAIIILAIHMAVLCAVPLALCAAFVRGMIVANRKMRAVMPTVQSYSRQMAVGAETISQRVAAPVISTRARKARWQGNWRRFSAAARQPFQTSSGHTDS